MKGGRQRDQAEAVLFDLGYFREIRQIRLAFPCLVLGPFLHLLVSILGVELQTGKATSYLD